MINFYKKPLSLAVALCLSGGAVTAVYADERDKTEEVLVLSEQLFADTTLVSPTSKITAEELQAINITTVEDVVAYEPSLVIRKRYIGDPNGVMGIRGSGMFQTTRGLVFADGLPLHYLLQTRWNGAPRWSLVGANEIESAEVIYGPFSAEYSGNAMGGVVDIKTRTPTERKISLEGTLFSQMYDELGTDDTFNGGKLFAAYEDKIGNFTIFASLSHLENDSQPMSNYFVSDLGDDTVTGAIPGKNDQGDDVLYIGDSGAEQSITDLYKVKLGYDFGDYQLRGLVAYEEREREDADHNNYLRDANGNTYWGAGAGNFQQRFHDRDSLLLGLGFSGKLSDEWVFDIYTTKFDILTDREIRTARNPEDPTYQARNEDFRGRKTEHGDTGWTTLDIKAGTESLLGNDDMRLSVGVFADSYTLEINPFNINSITGEVGSERTASGGETGTQALFAQWGWAFDEKWDLALGVRYEDWETKDGFLGDSKTEDRSETGTSPKFSIAYLPNKKVNFRYSLAKAYRFPIVEELYSNESSATNLVTSDPNLKPEVGIHHNITADYEFEGGLVRVNLFYDDIQDTIFNQTGVNPVPDANGVNQSVTTFLAIDEVITQGVEFIYNQKNWLGSAIDVRLNASYTEAEITQNDVNPDIEGNDLPRIPNWKANLILSYPVSQSVDLNTSFRYASDAFGDLDNGDREDNVFGAIDSYFFVNAKANWEVNDNTTLSIGVDNIFDELAYVAHPWPSRTLFLEGKLNF